MSLIGAQKPVPQQRKCDSDFGIDIYPSFISRRNKISIKARKEYYRRHLAPMAPQKECPTCCPQCRARGCDLAGASSSTSFDSLLAAGTVLLSIEPDSIGCTHQHAEDGWHVLPNTQLLTDHAIQEDTWLTNALTFLTRSSFIVATYRALHSRTSLRIYLVPYDHRSARACRGSRDEQVILKPARRHLHTVFTRISKSRAGWEGIHADLEPELIPFLPANDVFAFSRFI